MEFSSLRLAFRIIDFENSFRLHAVMTILFNQNFL